MASYENVRSRISIRLNGGTDQNGKQVIKTASVSKVNGHMSAQDLQAVAAGIAGLLDLPVMGVYKADTNALVE
ncbi:DUF1659 domain-containing protein [Thermanaerovibrio acidaminovorans]|mgnify:CR=1 FL=1|jgi:hypothetical protein|uniref:DUF1659 domain-containing protein n=1 Tax=Thermanaerovibrio acidaminovorans (strain ATCC 49978 / DSM 6589 / Su883) TaxID=525903 RepID=D1B714_THEAS|nr:DUF1659 domain-containing protein [Thermanaerovibrio acidaminovorans]ACZ19805.1 hypothetical protein Taci_1584 [Thermanaerovibrio acidaminovorans DSM 6589]